MIRNFVEAGILATAVVACAPSQVEPTPQPLQSAFRCANGDFQTSETNLPGDKAVILDAISASGINISQSEIDLWKDCYSTNLDELPIFHQDKPQEPLTFGTKRIKETINRMQRSENETFSKYGNLLSRLQAENKLKIGWDTETIIWYDTTDQVLRLDFDPEFIDLGSSQLSLATILVPLAVVLEDYQNRVSSIGFNPTPNEISNALIYTDDETLELHARAYGLRSLAWIHEVARLGESYGEPDKGFVEAAAQFERVGENWMDRSWIQFTFQNNPGLNQSS